MKQISSMNKEIMQHLIVEALSLKLGESYHLFIDEVLKNNLKVDALTIVKDGESIHPVISLDLYYSALKNGTPLELITSRILEHYAKAYAQAKADKIEVTTIEDFDTVKDKLFLKLINKHSNTALLQNALYSSFLDDFVITVRCIGSLTDAGLSSFLVRDFYLSIWNTDFDTVMAIAKENTKKLFGVTVEHLPSANSDLVNPMWCITNSIGINGATAVLFDDALKDFAEKQGNFHVIFSSINEALLIPTSYNVNIDMAVRIVNTANLTQVDEDELLGTKAYYYDKVKGFIL